MSKIVLKSALHPALSAPSDMALTVAHRGASKHAKENTLAAFERAIELGCDLIEFDVRRTADKVLIIHHDATIEGTNLRDLTYHELLSRFPSEHLATLIETLSHINKRVILNIEIKEEDLAREVLEVVRATYIPTEYVISSYHVSVLSDIRRLAPATCTGLILGSPVGSKSLLGHVKDLAPWGRFDEAQADFLALHHVLADLSVLRGARKRGIPVMVWTVNAPHRRRRFTKSRGVVAVMVDDPTRVE
jgi:glycerophosphoryl diester phosphodiesterase